MGGVNADDMGLGKTFQMAAVMKLHKKDTLVVTRSPVVTEWRDMLWRVTKKMPWILVRSSTCSAPTASPDNINAVTSYDALVTHHRKHNRGVCSERGCVFRRPWKRVVLDEAHHVRNQKTSAFRSVKRLKKDGLFPDGTPQIRWALTGTPINNGRFDLDALSEWLGLPRITPEIAKEVILRRTMPDIAHRQPREYPPSSDATIVRLTFQYEHEKRVYDHVHAVFKNALNAPGNKSAYLEAIMRMRQACVHPFFYHDRLARKTADATHAAHYSSVFSPPHKSSTASSSSPPAANVLSEGDKTMYDYLRLNREGRGRSTKVNYVVTRVREWCANSTDAKVLIFCDWILEIQLLERALRTEVCFASPASCCHDVAPDDAYRISRGRESTAAVVTFSGELDNMQKDAVKHDFVKNPGVRVLIAQKHTAGTGLNLQAANYVIITSPDWNPCNDVQAMCRAYRQGQLRRVVCERLVMTDTIEEYCLRVQYKKLREADDLLEESTNTVRLGFRGQKEEKEVVDDKVAVATGE